MSKYVPLTDANASNNFKTKNAATKLVINEALVFLKACGLPMEKLTARRLEKMAMAFLAVADVASTNDWPKLKTQIDNRSLTTRQIITWINSNFGETIADGSYDDIKRKDLKLPELAGIIVPTKPSTARNDSTRGYAVADEFGVFARMLTVGGYEQLLADHVTAIGRLEGKLSATRKVEKIAVVAPEGFELNLSPGKHNELQKSVVEEFLPRFGYGAELLYLGDTAEKLLRLQRDKLAALNFFELGHGELPDIIAYSGQKNWLFLIEAFYSTGPMSPIRLLQLQTLCKDCTAEIVFVTAFLDRVAFRKSAADIAWETEVWIAAEPDHLIHFNGGKFLGPHLPEAT